MTIFTPRTSGIQHYPEPHNYLRSTQPGTFANTSYTLAAKAHPVEPTETGIGENKKFLQRGEVLAKITSGDSKGKVGVFQQGASDGRGDVANIVGICRTFAPWELNERDVNVAADYKAVVVKGWVTIRDSAGKRIPIDDATVAGFDRNDLDVTWK